MKKVPITREYYHTVATLRLGGRYVIINTYGTSIEGVFVRVGKKGFNFINSKKQKTVLQKSFYQVDSAHKTIGRTQEYFEVRMPKWISAILEIDGDSQLEEEKEERVCVCLTRNALYRIELE